MSQRYGKVYDPAIFEKEKGSLWAKERRGRIIRKVTDAKTKGKGAKRVGQKGRGEQVKKELTANRGGRTT